MDGLLMDIENLFSVAGKVAVVTGGSRGIGRMIAEGFLRQGATVYISARKAEACDATAAELSKIGPCVSLPADVSITADVSIGPMTGKEGAFGVAVAMTVSVPGMDKDAAEKLVATAHEVCPYSNATRGNIDVALKVV